MLKFLLHAAIGAFTWDQYLRYNDPRRTRRVKLVAASTLPPTTLVPAPAEQVTR